MGYYYSGATLQHGSQGSDASELQKFLRDQGYYTGAIDGDFGDATLAALKDWQKASGLVDDGIFGAVSAKTAGFKNYNNPTAAPNINTTGTPLPTTDTTPWDNTEKGSAALANKNNIYGQLYGTYNPKTGKYEGGYGPFTFSQNGWLQDVLADIRDYGEFSYDVNGDALYQQMAEEYSRRGKLAMQDTMGQAAAMTGGYGNSYAQSVGQQAYQAHLQELNEVVPELYQMALNRYNMGKEDLYNQYGLLMSEHDREKGVYDEGYNKLLTQLGLANDDYYDGANLYLTEQDNKNTEAWNQWEAAEAIRQDSNDELWKQAEWDENTRRYVESKAGTSVLNNNIVTGDNKYSGKGTDPSGFNYDNGNYSDAQVIAAQKLVGANPDGKWGPNSVKAAKAKGYNSLAEAVAALSGGSQPQFTQTGATTNFIAARPTQFEYLQRGDRTLAEFQSYIKGEIEKATDLSDEEVAYLIRYYGLA